MNADKTLGRRAECRGYAGLCGSRKAGQSLNSKGDPVANLALWKRLFAAADARQVTVRWVRGHTGDRCNEKADALANKALALKTRSDA